VQLPADTDTGALEQGYVVVTALGPILDDPGVDLGAIGRALEGL
jgi:hypothetical protein